ncbi:MAG: DUF815 domain-containing protein, partial [Eubacterium sp.]|nr:DUF815 domain-containing protein [Eubacterium sp.]
MENIDLLKFYIDSLCVYNVKEDEVISKLRKLLENAKNESVYKCYSEFFSALINSGKTLKGYISSLILYDENAFTKAAAKGGNNLDKALINAVRSDLEKLERISEIKIGDIISDDNKEILETLPVWETGENDEVLSYNWQNSVERLIEFHKQNGYGIYAKYCAFAWRNGEFAPIASVDSIRLSDLINYERQREQVIENTLVFLDGFPANNI